MADGMIFVNPFDAMARGQILRDEALARKTKNEQDAFNLMKDKETFEQNKRLQAELAGGATSPAGGPFDGKTAPETPDFKTESAANLPAEQRPYAIPPIPEVWKLDLQQYQENKRLAGTFRKYGQYTNAQNADNQAGLALQRANTAQKEYYERQQKQYEMYGNAIAAIRGPEDIGPMLTTIAQVVPDLVKNSPFQRDPVTGQYLWDTPLKPGMPSNKQLVEVMGRSVESQKDRADRVHKEWETYYKGETLAETQRHRLETELAARRANALAQSKLNLEKETRQDKLDERQEARDIRFVEKEQVNLDKSKELEHFPKAVQSYATARDIMNKLARPGGYDLVSTSDAQQFVKAFGNMVSEYRTRTGGKYETAEIDSMMGAYQKLQNWVNTVGEGNKRLDPTEMRNAFNSMTNLYNNRNASAVKRSLESLDVLRKRVKDPKILEQFVIRGDVREAIDSGRAVTKIVDGKTIISFGEGPQNKFYLPEGY